MKIPNWLLQIISGLLAILLVVLIINQLLAAKNNSRNISDKHLITISAQGKVTAAPDLVTITATVITDADTAAHAQSQNTKKMDNVLNFVKSAGIADKDIQTSAYNIYPKYDYKSGAASIIGYTANQTINIKAHDLNAVGSLLDGLTQNGINQIQNVSYSFDNPDNLREQAREKALANAKDKAQRLANAAGVVLGELISFNEDANNYPVPPIYYDAKSLASPMATGSGFGSAPSSQLQPGTQEINAQITVTYSLK